MRILVIGGMGFIGHNVVSQLEDLGHDVEIIDSLTNYGIIPEDELSRLIDERSSQLSATCHLHDIPSKGHGIDTLFRTFKPEIVIHLASMPNQKIASSNPELSAKTMTEGLVNICEKSCQHKVKRFVYISSSMVYGNFSDGIREDANCSPAGLYGILKLAGERIVEDYSRRGSIEHVIIRPSAVYGPRDIVDRVVSKFLRTAMLDQVLIVNGSDECLDFSYVDDVASGIVGASLSDATTGKTYNITRGRSRSLLEAAELAVRIAGKGRIEIKDRDKNFPKRGSLNIDAAHIDFGFKPKIDIEQGFQLYYEYLM